MKEVFFVIGVVAGVFVAAWALLFVVYCLAGGFIFMEEYHTLNRRISVLESDVEDAKRKIKLFADGVEYKKE